MKPSPLPLPGLLSIALATVLCTAPLHAQTATQNVILKNGWNSVWLEVSPVEANGDAKGPQGVFSDSRIVVVATPKPLAGIPELFADDPDAGGTIGTFNQAEWQQWHNPAAAGFVPADAIGDNLGTIGGNRPYLVKVAGAPPSGFALPVAGKARFFRPTWVPDRYNLVGFGIEGTISFANFFAPAAAKHPVARIYALNSAGNWAPVVGTSPIVDGVAYWIFCNGNSDYMGPVAVDFALSDLGVLNFGGPSDAVPVNPDPNTVHLDLEEVVFTNRGTGAPSPTLALVTPDPGAGATALRLHLVSPNATNLGYQTGNPLDFSGGAVSLNETVPSGETVALTIGALRNWITAPVARTNLYRLTTGNPGTRFYLPLSADSTGVPPSNDTDPLLPLSPVAGLWVGEVSLDAVTSIVEDGEPTRPAAGSAPIRLLLHSDADGHVTLLNQVTIMQRSAADTGDAPEPVLVIDPRRIPYFEGIKERNGKRVGLRLQTVAYDMPRDTRLAAQQRDPANPAEADSDDLLDMIVNESTSPVTNWLNGAGLYPDRGDVTEAAIASYLLFRSLRPPALKEAYQLSLPMTGAIGPDKLVQTTPGTLTLDPFHRTNPFRHAFSQKHPKGPQVTREMSIVFDPEQPVGDRLRGTYSESIQGLTKSTLELSGRVELQRVSSVSTLEGAASVPAP